ncbi:hypothetical protein TeGR_g5901 [Tetraparma gracilis]|uniref:G-protein coupled receptors family 1 profile domain-containing protein n=1 Tax=Tetraparma gracilis TaxID=2962635 RepID=A0ABQ6NBT4_9STRA|nr:hypothetical protein TeGR_g5901 [Tetraparma gracilis]
MADYPALYDYNFHNATVPLPPLQSSITKHLVPVSFCLLLTGSVFSIALLVPLSRASVTHNQNQRHGQLVQCIFDLVFYITWFVLAVPPYTTGEVPNHLYCQVNGALAHWSATSQFSAITGLAYERYYRLCQLRDNDTAGARHVAPHWRVFKRLIAPLLFLHALLPILTSSAYGHFGPYRNNAACFGLGGRGVIGHDLFQLANVVYFLGCMCLTAVTSVRSVKIIRSLLSSSNVSSTASTKTAVKAERRLMLFSLCVTVLFLFCWAGYALFFLLPSFGFKHPTSATFTSSPRFFDYLLVSASCTALNPIINLYFDAGLLKLVKGYFFREKRARRIGSAKSTMTTHSTADWSAARTRRQQHTGSCVSVFG